MAGANTSGYKFDSVVGGKSAWTPFTNKMHKCTLREDNKCDKYAVNDRLKQHPKGECTYPRRY